MVLKGSLVALVTPMRPDGTIDMTSTDRLIEWHIQSGTQALVILGTTGESATITFDERELFICHVIKRVEGRLPVVVGTGTHSTQETCRLTQQAADLGADACLLVTPYYNKPMQEGLYQHYCTVAESVSVPQILYNVPGRTACDLLPETVARLAKLPHIVGIKEATPDIERLHALKTHCADCGKNFLFFSGDDSTASAFILAGGHGVISVTANVVPRAMNRLVEAAIQGNDQRVQDLSQVLSDLHSALFVVSNPIPVKWALFYRGMIPLGIRLPLTPLPVKYQSVLIDAITKASINELSEVR